MKPPLDQLIQRFEQIVLQLKTLEVMFSSTSEIHSHRSLTNWKNIVSIRANSFDLDSSRCLPDCLFQVDEDSSKE